MAPLSRREALAGTLGAGLLAATPAFAAAGQAGAARDVLTRLFGPSAGTIGLSLETRRREALVRSPKPGRKAVGARR